jgi:alpha-galactosidase
MRTVIQSITCGRLTALYRMESETGVVELLLVPTGMETGIVRVDCAAEPLIQVHLSQDDAPAFFSGGRTMRGSPSTTAVHYVAQSVEHSVCETCISTQLQDPRGYDYTHMLRMFPDKAAAEIEVSFINRSEKSVVLEMLSSFTLGCLSPFSSGLAPETLRIHRLRSTWSAEGRLCSQMAESLQLEPSWKCYSANCLRFGNVGSFPVRGYVPFCAVEDTEHGVTWAAAPTHGSSWQLELYRKDNGLSLSGGLADREFGQWAKTVPPGGNFHTPKAVVTAVVGGVDKAAQALAENTRRAIETRLPVHEVPMPIVFNEFCTTWGQPTERSILRQIAALRGRGIGYYVIDAGWFDDNAFETAARLGKWQVSNTAFPHGIKPVVDSIHAAGMKAGIWFEFEIAGRDEPDCFNHTEWLLCLSGKPITAGSRRFWDMRKPEVRDYLAERVVMFLRKNGFDYMKVDYNETIGIGCDSQDGAAPGEGLREQIEASQAFFMQIRNELPDLVLEICASGGHRLCHSFLELSCMASFSDAHECDEIPIIAANMHRIMLPRQSQIWAVIKAGQPLQKLYYQICSGLLGRLCFSGQPDALSPEQWAVIDAGIAFYQKAVPVIDHGQSSFFGPSVASYRAPRGWQTIVRHGTAYTLAVAHTFSEAPDTISLPVSGRVHAVFARPGITAVQNDLTKSLCLQGLRDFDAAAVLLQKE